MPYNNRMARADTGGSSHSGQSTPPLVPPAPMGRRNRRFSLQPTSSRQISRSPSPNPSPISKPKLPTKSHFKVLILGAGKVGKTCLIHRFLYNTFSPKYHKTVEEMHSAEFNFNRAKLNLNILDTAGAFDFPAMRDLNIQSSDGFILVFSLLETGSLEEIVCIRDQVVSAKGSNVPIVLVMNKSDDPLSSSEKGVLQRDKAEEMARIWDHGFVECSAKSGESVTQVFKELLTQAKVQYRLSPALKKRRQSLPGGVATGQGGLSHFVPTPTAQQLSQLRERSKRNSCTVS